ncbi:MAG TPA: SRPBCC family protein [Rhodanobacteraceae bacterium]|nr:SRPBCC family protein [Rhodanobacteraceae bacterium]
MTRVLEFVVALIIVFILAVIVGVCLPSHAHIERSIEISHNPEHIYDVLMNFRRFGDSTGAWLKAEDPGVQFTSSGPAYGPGATLSWKGNKTIGDGTVVNKGGQINISNHSTVTWALTNDWHGRNKTFTFDVQPRQDQRVTKVTWSYDVDYGWNLIGRYSALWIHGDPSALIEYGLGSLQNMLAGIANVDYSKVHPGLYRSDATPVLVVSTKAPRTVDDIDTAKAAAMKEIQAAMAKLGVKAAGPTTTIRTEWGDTTFIFDLAVPINSTTLNVNGKSVDLTKLPPPPTAAQQAAAAASAASAAKAASASSAASAGSAGQPASGSSSGGAASNGPAPGSLDKQNRLVVDANVRAMMMPAGEVLVATWTGESGVQFMVTALEAYAATHGYKFDESAAPAYNQLASLPTVSDDDQIYRVFLPVSDAPAQTPDQKAGLTQPLTALDPSLWAAENTKPAETKGKAEKKKEARKRPEHRKRHRR